MNESEVVRFETDGSASAIYDDDQPILAMGGKIDVLRAGFVEPTSDGMWSVDTTPSGGRNLGELSRRSDALKMEVQDIALRLQR